MPRPVSALTLARPRSLRAALQVLRDDPALRPIAGCTDVYVGLHFGTESSTRFLDLWGLEQLRDIDVADGRLRLGALTTYTDLIRSALVGRRVPMLVAAAREIGGAQIQHRGTIGGNIANASPAGDTLPVLLAADARIILQSASGERAVPFRAFQTGYRSTVRRPDELIVAIEIPRIDGRQWWRKVGTRRAQAIAKVTLAGVRGDAVEVALGAVAPTAIRVPEAAGLLATTGSVPDAQAALAREVAPIDDVRSTALYRRTVAVSLLARFWADTA